MNEQDAARNQVSQLANLQDLRYTYKVGNGFKYRPRMAERQDSPMSQLASLQDLRYSSKVGNGFKYRPRMAEKQDSPPHSSDITSGPEPMQDTSKVLLQILEEKDAGNYIPGD